MTNSETFVGMTESRWREAGQEAEFGTAALWAYLWEIAEAYKIPFPREGERGADIHQFLVDIREAFVRAGWVPPERPTDMDWSTRFQEKVQSLRELRAEAWDLGDRADYEKTMGRLSRDAGNPYRE